MSRNEYSSYASMPTIPPRTSSTRDDSAPQSPPQNPAIAVASSPPQEASWISPTRSKGRNGMSHSQHHSHARSASIMNASDQTHVTWSPAKEKILRGPFDYLVNVPGKNIRKAFVEAFNKILQVPPESVETINNVVAILHTASLLVDDVEDSSELRRGIPVAHAIYGVAQTLNSANYMYFVALQELVKLNNPTALHIYTEEMCNLHRGQGMDLFWRDTLTVPTEDEYLEMVGNKTGGLFRLAIKLMQAESPTGKNCVPLAGLLGVVFQIRDDYMNLWSNDYSSNKGMCEDLTEGKFSFPVIHSIRANPNSLVLINILKQKTKDETVKRYAVGYMEQTGSFAYCRKVLDELIEQAGQMIDELEEEEAVTSLLLGILGKMNIDQTNDDLK